MEKKLICIICPRGCELTADINGESVSVSGNACKRGMEYAMSECINPLRTVTSVVRVANRNDTMVSVKTTCGVPKAKIAEIMSAIREKTVEAPVKEGQVIIEDLFGASLIATKNIP